MRRAYTHMREDENQSLVRLVLILQVDNCQVKSVDLVGWFFVCLIVNCTIIPQVFLQAFARMYCMVAYFVLVSSLLDLFLVLFNFTQLMLFVQR